MNANEKQQLENTENQREKTQHRFNHMIHVDLQVRPLASKKISPGIQQCLCGRKTDDPASSPAVNGNAMNAS